MSPTDSPEYYDDLRDRLVRVWQRTGELVAAYHPPDVDQQVSTPPETGPRARLVEYQRLKAQHLWLDLMLRYGREDGMLKHMAPFLTELDQWTKPGGGPSHAYCLIAIEALLAYHVNARTVWAAFLEHHWPALATMVTTCQTFFEMARPDKVIDVGVAHRLGQELYDQKLSSVRRMESTHVPHP